MTRLLHWDEVKDKADLQGDTSGQPLRERGGLAATASRDPGRRLLSPPRGSFQVSHSNAQPRATPCLPAPSQLGLTKLGSWWGAVTHRGEREETGHEMDGELRVRIPLPETVRSPRQSCSGETYLRPGSASSDSASES